MPRVFLGVDVGTGSVRAGLFDKAGIRLGMGVSGIKMFQPQPDFVEQSSDDIWTAAGLAIRQALSEAKCDKADVAGIGFDATCSLVVLGEQDEPLSVSPTGNAEQNIIVWMDHRAIRQAERINATKHDVLQYVGGVISPEMQTPKLLWLKECKPDTFERARKFFDLPDFLSYRATGNDTRSLCTVVCKWTYRGDRNAWDASYFSHVGLKELADEDFVRIGTRISPMGESVGGLTVKAAEELGLSAGTPVSVSIIDAHAGGIGLIGVPLAPTLPLVSCARACPQPPPPSVLFQHDAQQQPTSQSQPSLPSSHELVDFNTRLALIGGTSSCHMAVSRDPRFVPGVWGPYFSAMVPGYWLTEGGQSATGALIDHVIHSHARASELRSLADARGGGCSVYTLLNETLARLVEERSLPFPAALTYELHVYPDFHGNRSPLADPTLRGMMSGLTLNSGSVEELAILYLATIQAVAHGTRHIIEQFNAQGYSIDTLVMCGGDTKNPVFLREHADVTGCRVVLTREPEAVLLGAAVLGAVAANSFPSLEAAVCSGAMNAVATVLEPPLLDSSLRAYHDKKHSVFLRMYRDQLAYRAIMGEK